MDLRETSTETMRQRYVEMREQLGQIIVGLDEVIEQLLVSLFTGGHCLLIGVPGLAKTLLIRSVAELLSLEFRRIQFTPDLMPADITGTEVIAQDRDSGEREFRFLPGPVFTQVLLADEINRTPPKTQAALLEAMEEGYVTSVGKRYALTRPFFVLATQNPIEQEGTYPLPTAQLDRFLFNVRVDYPSFADEAVILRRTTTLFRKNIEPMLSRDEVLGYIELVRRRAAPEQVVAFAVQLIRATRPGAGAPDFVNQWLAWGAGPRAAQALILGAKARALLHGRNAASIDDVRVLAKPVLRHRLILNFQAEADHQTTDGLVDRLLREVAERNSSSIAPASTP
ncbi:MAG: MoxR family ATPase [Planctomycetes bacterium]|nr:MoxR family ATPase [Planctomycetota bacterium]MBI3846488.1 MoxR family ATPase [Planctomycetota bacterium]